MTFPKLIVNTQHHDAGASAVELAPGAGQLPASPTPYLTDEVHLYRTIATVGDDSRLVGLEDCRSLEVILAAPEDLRALRAVKPDDHGRDQRR